MGRAGSGKTESVRGRLKELAEAGKEGLFLIVPEQSSFENERAMLRLLGARNAGRVCVTSFSRLAEEAFRRYGGGAGRRLDDGGRSILMSLALEQVKDRLEFYRRNAESEDLVGLMLGVSAEFKMCALSAETIAETAERMPRGTLKRKMTELSLILSAYDALVAQSYIDPQDDLTRLRETLLSHPYFQGCTVAVDSFQSFTVQEYGILEQILVQADHVTVTLCADHLDDPEQGMGLFSLVRRTGKNLIRLAKRNGIPVAAPVVLKSGTRFHSPALAALEEGVYRPSRTAWEGGCDAAAVYEARNAYDEAAFAASTIRNLVMNQGMRYRDFAVIARTPEKYRGILDSAFERRDIPYFMDDPQPVDAEPLMRLVLSAFRAVRYGFRSDDVFQYLKTGLAGLSAEETALLENYGFVWNLSGGKWREEWTENPRGFSGEFTDRDKRMLREINALRRRAVEPLFRFAEKTREGDGEQMASAVYDLLCDTDAARNLKQLAARLAADGTPQLAERELRLWDLLMEILDQTALTLSGRTVSRARYADLLHLVIRSGRIASIPQGLDEVTVGAANRIRTVEPKAVFLIGASQGEFPLAPGGNCVLSDGERRALIAMGLPLNDTMEGVAVQERFLAYSALSAASERLYVSYPVSDAQGRAVAPSTIPREVRSILKKVRVLSESELSPLYFADAAAPAFALTARMWNAGEGLSAALKQVFSERGERERLAAVERAAVKKPARFSDPARARALFGDEMRVSATQIEKYHLCRFQYFCRYGLDVKERRAAELDALEYGSLMHYLLERLFREVGSAKIAAASPAELREIIVGFLNAYAEAKLGGLQNRTPRFAYLVSRLADAAMTVARHIAEELEQSEFVPVGFELGIGDEIPSLVIPLPDGGSVRIDGKVDRVDRMEKNGVPYLRVVDYKTGHRDFKLSDVIYGMNMQMLVYLAALCENGGERCGGAHPAGVLYMPASRPSVLLPRGAPEKKREAETEKQLRMDGLVLDDPEIIRGMEKKAEGKYLPVSLKNGVPSGKEHVVSAREMENTLRYIRRLIAAMAAGLRSGNVEALPLSGRYDACAWCPYGAVCGHERDDAVREMQKWDRDAVLAELGKDGAKK